MRARSDSNRCRPPADSIVTAIRVPARSSAETALAGSPVEQATMPVKAAAQKTAFIQIMLIGTSFGLFDHDGKRPLVSIDDARAQGLVRLDFVDLGAAQRLHMDEDVAIIGSPD